MKLHPTSGREFDPPARSDKVYVVKRDLLRTNQECIVHQVNCVGDMGSDITKTIRRKFPQHYLDYKNMAQSCINKNALLGKIVVTKMPKYDVIGMFAQYGDGANEKCYTDYKAFFDAFSKVCAAYHGIAVPYGIGCGLGGGGWNVIKDIINQLAGESDNVVSIEICKKR